MILTLEVTGPQAQEMGAGARKAFKAIGGTIGRLPDNDWVFPDPYVSGRHALIRYVNGKFFVEDTSTNGVFINSPDQRLTRGQPQQLRDGDLLYIDAYQINVSIQNDADPERRNDPFGGLKSSSPKLTAAVPRAAAPTPVAADDRTENLAVLKPVVLNKDDSTVAQDLPVPADDDDQEQADEELDEDDAGTEWYGVADMSPRKPATARLKPEVVKSTVAVPLPRPEARRPAPPPPKAVPNIPAVRTKLEPIQRSEPRASAAADSQLQTLLAAAGIEGLDPSSEIARTLGEMLRISVGGVMEALRTRERMKDDMRMRGTSFKPTDNNPLKFSANVDDAFHNLLVKRNSAYLSPDGAMEDAFRDVRDHQAAFLAAMRLAFESMLAQFDPQRMQEEFDRQMKGSILGVPAKLRYWDLYRDKYGELVKDAETGFRTLFGDAFARAYEEHLERLNKASRPAG